MNETQQPNLPIKKKNTGCLKIVLIVCAIGIAFFIIVGIIGAVFGKSSDEIKAEKQKEAEELSINAEKKELNDKNQKNSELYSKIQTELKSFEKPFERGNIGYKGLLNMIEEYRNITLKGERSEVDSIINLTKKLKPHVIDFQVKHYPIIRKEYAEEMNKKMWEFDVEVKYSGKGNKELTYIGGMFAANKNIKEAYDRMYSDVMKMRFSKVNFKWIPSADEWDYYSVSSLKDNEF